MRFIHLVSAVFLGCISPLSFAAELKIGDPAPLFEVKTDEGNSFRLEDRKGKWTVLYFYPKADTPGCTKQACTYRDTLQTIRKEGAEVYGISADAPSALQEFKKKHRLNFTLLSDPDAKVIESYGAKMPVVKMAKRWTFLIGPELTVRHIAQGVDPVKDAANVAEKLRELKAAPVSAK